MSMRIGAQMYTTREACRTLEGFALTLRRIADIGYRYVQVRTFNNHFSTIGPALLRLPGCGTA